MLLSASAVLLIGLLIWMLVRVRYLRWPEIALCTTFGFLLAETAAAPVIRTALETASDILAGFTF